MGFAKTKIKDKGDLSYQLELVFTMNTPALL